jgi:SAM-dependent methyltransferase
MSHPGDAAKPYVFGVTDAEISRLQQLADLLGCSTLQALREAGIAEGMNVLDIGCGPGSVTFLAGELVGPAGSVVGIDRNPAMVAAARARALFGGQPNVSFLQADLAGLGGDEGWLQAGFDAVVGRLILLHLPDPVPVLRRLAGHLRPGGIVVFQEPDLARMGASFPPIPALEQLCEQVREAHRELGIDCQFGLRLRQIFQDAGLPQPSMKCEAFIGSGPGWGWYEQMIRARNALPVLFAGNRTAAQQAGLDALAEQVRVAVAGQGSVTRAIDLISAWTRTRPTPP